MSPSLLTPRILWAALLASQAMYVGLMVIGIFEVPEEPPDAMMLPVLGVVALGTGAMSFVVPAFVRKSATEQVMRKLPQHEATDAAIFRAALEAGFAPFILSIALSEAVAIFGLVLSALGFPLLYCLPFSALGAMLTLIRFPMARTFLAPFEEKLGRSVRI